MESADEALASENRAEGSAHDSFSLPGLPRHGLTYFAITCLPPVLLVKSVGCCFQCPAVHAVKSSAQYGEPFDNTAQRVLASLLATAAIATL